jgi:hypothetical protein
LNAFIFFLIFVVAAGEIWCVSIFKV